MNILFYTPVNFRCRDIESLAKQYTIEGHDVILLSTCEEGELHFSFREMGMRTYGLNKNVHSSQLCLIVQLVSFCKRNKIDLLFSHLEPTNFTSVIAQYFISAKVIVYRHHVDLASLQGFNDSITYKLVYRLAKEVISVSQEAKRYMISIEGVSPLKVTHINLGYDFSLYKKMDLDFVNSMRVKYVGQILLVTAGSLDTHKRPHVSMEIVRQARAMGLPVTLLMIGRGPEESTLKTFANHLHIGQYVSFVGYTSMIIDYLASADWLIHPSISESSCVVVKEAALVELPVMVCKGVGDFDNYMLHENNGIVLDRDNFIEEALLQLKQYQRNPKPFREMGRRLKIEIMDRFAIDRVYPQYAKFTL